MAAAPALSGPKDTHGNAFSQTCLLRPTGVQEEQPTTTGCTQAV